MARAAAEHASAGRIPGPPSGWIGIWKAMFPPGKSKWKIGLALEGIGLTLAYQCGIFAGLHREGLDPDIVLGESVGSAIAAIIASNDRSRQIPALQRFWEHVPASPELVGVPAVTGFRAVRAGVRVLLGKGLLSLEPLRTTLYELVDFDKPAASSHRFHLERGQCGNRTDKDL